MATFWRGATSPRGASRVARLKQAERDWQKQVLQLLGWRGWAAYHTYDSRKSAAGFPDITAVRMGRLVFLELKTETGIVSDAQQAWIDALAQCPGVTALVARPSDWALLEALLA
jgi:hypothetical protein